MPITQSAKKALRQDKRRKSVNRRVKTILKLSVRAFREKMAAETLSKAYQSIDRAVKRNLMHKKKASRMKSQLSKMLPASTK